MATLAERLSEAETALHRLQTGDTVVSVTTQSGERIEYRPNSLARLSAYVADLRRQAAGRSAKRTFNPTRTKGF